MGLLYELESQMERELPVRLQQSLQQSLDDYRAHCPGCQLAMHRHHRYPRSIMTRYGELQLQIPVFRCGECQRMTSGMELLGDEERYRRYSKKTGELAVKLAALGLSYAQASRWVGSVKSTLCRWVRREPLEYQRLGYLV